MSKNDGLGLVHAINFNFLMNHGIRILLDVHKLLSLLQILQEKMDFAMPPVLFFSIHNEILLYFTSTAY